MMRFRGGVGAAFLALASVGTVVLGACADQKGALMLAVSTDMKAPKDVNAVSVTISTNGAIKHSFIGRVTPQGEVLLPATLAIVEPDDSSASIRIRVVAFQDRKPRVLRDVRTTVPTKGRTALLRIPLNFANDGSTKSAPLPEGVLPPPLPGTGGTTSGGTTSGAPSTGAADFDFFGAFQPECPDVLNQTIVDGVCVDNFVDSSGLPDFSAALVGDSLDKGQCFDVGKCFATATMITDGTPPSDLDAGARADASSDGSAPSPDAGKADGGGTKAPTSGITLDRASCSLQLNGANPQRLNLALITPDTGECVRPGECYIPIDHGGAGWKEAGGRVQLPQFVCTLLAGKNLRLATSAETCAAKEESNPICAEKPVASEPAGAGCAGLATAVCTKIMGCDFGYSGYYRYGDIATCTKDETDWCELSQKAPGSTPRTAECNASYNALSCDDWFLSNTYPKCFAGTLPDASPCQYGRQCSSLNCSTPAGATSGCGTCAPRFPIDGPCSSWSDCDYGLICGSAKKCVKQIIVAVGGDCSAPESYCTSGSFCTNSKCTANLAPGARCSSASYGSCGGAYACAPSGSPDATCTKIVLSTQVGATCSQVDLQCAYGLYCKTDTVTSQGTCQADLAVGSPCTSGDTCAGTARCTNNVCTAPDPLLCNKP